MPLAGETGETEMEKGDRERWGKKTEREAERLSRTLHVEEKW